MPVKADLAVTALVAGAALNDHTEIVNICKNMVLIRPPVNLNSGQRTAHYVNNENFSQ